MELIRNKTVAFHTLGCKLNYSETSTLSRLLESEGFEKREFDEPADVYVINRSCPRGIRPGSAVVISKKLPTQIRLKGSVTFSGDPTNQLYWVYINRDLNLPFRNIS